MDFDKLVLQRESVRKYTDKEIAKEDIVKCIEAARMTPSAHNSQPWTFIVVDDAELLGKLADTTVSGVVRFNKFVKDAKTMVAVVIEKTHFAMVGSNKTDDDYNMIDIGAATEHFCLQAAELGIGTCILGYFQEDKAKELLNIPSNKKLGLMISMGYSQFETSREKKRKKLDEILRLNSYK
ncbi:MAG: nitroreductase family protein [Eubacteriales bacterium]